MKKIILLIAALTCSYFYAEVTLPEEVRSVPKQFVQNSFNGRSPKAIDLSGEWGFQLDWLNRGVEEQWFTTRFSDTIRLPGTTDEEKKGQLNTRTELQKFTRLFPYEGAAWYQKEIEIPEDWDKKELYLFMELTKNSSVWVDDQSVGKRISLTAPHQYNLSRYLTPGMHRISVRIENKDYVSGWAHQVSDDTQTNWNGILGRIELQLKNRIHITKVRTYPDIHEKKVDIKVWLNKKCKGKLIVSANAWNTDVPHTIPPREIDLDATTDSVFSISLPMGDAVQLWDEFNPNLYKLKVDLLVGEDDVINSDNQEIDFGMKEFTVKGTQFHVNGKTVFLRGKHESFVFPLTGHVPMQVDEWVRIFKIAKSYGINHYRYHTCTPPEAGFLAADMVGIYMEPQLPYWGQVGNNKDKIDVNDVELKTDNSKAEDKIKYMLFEGKQTLDAFGNHASFCMYSLGNELHGNRELMSNIVSEFRHYDRRHLYASGSNNFFKEPVLSKGDDYWATTFTEGHYTAGEYHEDTEGFEVRSSFPVHTTGQINNLYPSTTYDYNGAIRDVPVPIISHESGQFQVYPNYREIEKFTGVVRAKNYEVFRERLKNAGMSDQADDFFKASGALSVLCYREDIEAAVRTKGFGGFQMLDLQDFPGQGTALVGILDVFMNSKGLIAPKKWKEFCDAVVPLLRMEKYTWTDSEKFTAKVQLANYGTEEIKSDLDWKLLDYKGKTLKEGTLAANVDQGTVGDLDHISFDLAGLKAPQKLELQLALADTSATNTYPIWLYPANVSTKPTKGIRISETLDKKTLNLLEKGGKVLLIPNAGLLEDAIPGAFQSDFWCYPMFKKYDPPGTLGILCDPEHPLFKEFPTEFHSNWQWWPILRNGNAMILDNTPKDFRPLVQVVDNFDRNHKLGVIFECTVGKGKLLVCSGNLRQQQNYPEVRQLQHSIIQYMNGGQFNPSQSLNAEQLKGIFIK